VSSEAERRLTELLALLESGPIDSSALERAGRRVEAALGTLTRATAPADLARAVDLHACVREAVARARTETGRELAQLRADRARLSHLTRPDDSARSVDYRA
jgi:hypothetical protein